MSYTSTLQLGVPTLLTKNTVYALPTLRSFISCTESTPTLKVANKVDMSASVTLTLDANGEANLAAMFIQATDADHTVVVKSY